MRRTPLHMGTRPMTSDHPAPMITITITETVARRFLAGGIRTVRRDAPLIEAISDACAVTFANQDRD
jgi:hypothetical protein